MAFPFPVLQAEEAAELIQNGHHVGFSGFTPAGAAKAIPVALAARAEREHAAGRPFQIGVLTGASTGPSLDGVLAKAKAINFRTPYQTDAVLRKQINAGEVRFVDMHLSMLPQMVRYGNLGRLDWAVVEACDLTAGGGIVLTTSVGASPTFLHRADRILIELNQHHPPALIGMHDILEPEDPPTRRELPIYTPRNRVGSPIVVVPISKIAGVVKTDLADECAPFGAESPLTEKIGNNIAQFLLTELRTGRIPKEFLPLQSGVGDVANCVLAALGKNLEIPPFEMYTEVLQDSLIPLLESERCQFASTCALTLSPKMMQRFQQNLPFFRSRVIMRPQEISNHPELVRRLGVVSMNTAIEVDLFGNVNSTHILGREMMNGIGGSGDFTRNAYVSIFSCPSIQKGGKISTIVPVVSHMDHSEHSVQIVATEWGVADLRGRAPIERAHLLIENCAHPEYREQLLEYLEFVRKGHTPHSLAMSFAMHRALDRVGDMRHVHWAEWRSLVDKRVTPESNPEDVPPVP